MKYCLVGKGISYSLSKKIHELIYDLYKIDATYEIRDEASFPHKELEGYNGYNITIPYKDMMLDEVDELSTIADSIKSINCIQNIEGRLIGHNTDYFGFKEMLDYFDINVNNKDVVILGNGATSRTIEYVCREYNTRTVKFVTRHNDSNLSYDDDIKGDILINATPVKDSNLISLKSIGTFSTVIDLNYKPFHSTLLVTANRLQKNVYNGLYMLVAQAVYANRIWFNKDIDVNHVYRMFIKSYLNIAFIGFMGTGKTTIGRMVADKLNLKFVDADSHVENTVGKSIPNIFKDSKEAGFRTLEHDVIKEMSNRNGMVIATGGGVILNEENINLLRQNSIIICLERDIEDVLTEISITDRPLAKNIDNARDLYSLRMSLYQKHCDYLVKNNDINDTVNAILNIWENV